jgi:hypothetical protein
MISHQHQANLGTSSTLEYWCKEVKLDKERNFNAQLVHRDEITKQAQNEAMKFVKDRRGIAKWSPIR